MEAMEKHDIDANEAERMCDIVSDLLAAYAEDVERTEPYATKTVQNNRSASDVVSWLGSVVLWEE